ncbi:hypothetical protein, partial [Roseivivax lentus]|uniref:hypothetical protein n=1 Tax=Roseivivax lentus TaxID=633194 RepID=UPI001F37F6BF
VPRITPASVSVTGVNHVLESASRPAFFSNLLSDRCAECPDIVMRAASTIGGGLDHRLQCCVAKAAVDAGQSASGEI